MKTETAPTGATYRVPTRDEMRQFVDLITEGILLCHRFRHWNCGNGKPLAGISLLDQSDEFLFHHFDGSCEVRHVDELAVDSVECLPANLSRPKFNVVPAWLKGGES